MANKDKGSDGTVASNRRAYHDYFIDEKIEAGIELLGPEVKSARARHVSLGEAHAEIKGGEVFLIGAHMTPYKAAHIQVDPVRTRKLLLTKKEIQKLQRQVQQKGYTLVPLRMYFGPSGYAKVELGLARGKKMFDKRESIAERDAERRTERAMAEYNKRGARGGDEG